MIASHRPDEITFYEELGVAPGASPEEIRNAFRALVRLFHPDHQTDPQLKDIAERQMRKLNRVYAVLSDQERRRQYDEVLDGRYIPTVVVRPVFKPGLRQFLGRTASFAAILLGAGLLIWLTPESSPGPQSFAHDPYIPTPYVPVSPSTVPAVDQGPLIASLRSDLRAVALERSVAIRELKRLRGTESDPQADSSADVGEPQRDVELKLPAVALTELPLAKLPAFGDSIPGHAESLESRNIAGIWFYAKPLQAEHSSEDSLQDKVKASWQPDRIEARISEQDGKIYGKYRVRFHIADPVVSPDLVSPDLNFAFTGTLGAGPQFTFPWTGDGGAKGELAVKVISANSLRIEWHATQLGLQQGPDAGTAILTRGIE
jgi:hypothetical protein